MKPPNKIKRDTTNRELLTQDINQEIETGDYSMKEFVKVYGNNLPITKRVDTENAGLCY